MPKVYFLLFCFLFIACNTLNISAQHKTAPKPINQTKINAPLANPAPASLSFEAQVLAEINLARQKPLEYVKILEDLRKNYNGNELRLPNRTAIVTNEGTKVVDEAIAYLKALKPLGGVTESKGLFSAARDHLQDMQKTGGRGHQGSDGSLPNARIERYGSWEVRVSEIIKYGAQTPREVVIDAILDDGVPERSHRKDIFDGKFKIAGIAAGDGGKYDKLCVIVMTANLTEKGSSQNKVRRF